MHECFTVRDWIRAWTEVETEDLRLSAGCWNAEPGRGVPGSPVGACGAPDGEQGVDAGPGVPDEVVACPRCMAACDELDALLEELEHFDPAVAAEALDDEELFRALEALPPDEQLAYVGTDRRFHRWSLCQRFLAVAQSLWLHDPALARARASTAVAIADALDEETYHPRWVADLRAKAHAYLGNSFRVLTRFAEAERELVCATHHLHLGVESGQREARVLSFLASLRIDEGRHPEAEALLERLESYYRASDQRTELARTQLKRAVVLACRGAYREAAEECARAYGNIDGRRESRLALLACQNAVIYLVEAGELARARSLFASLPPTDERVLLLRRRWIEADLLRAEDRFDLAMEAYEDARRGYAEEGIPYDVAVISLDQAMAAYEMGDYERMRALTGEAEALLGAAGARRETLAVLRVLAAAVEQGTVTRSVLAAIRKRVASTRPSC